VHSVYKPMPGRFKDYIAIPRVNGYQSLHTTLFGPNGVPIEVQIRTDDMHASPRPASPRTGSTRRAAADGRFGEQDRAREWLSHLMEMQAGRQLRGILESVKVDLFPDKVYVFTPKGEILRLPRGATVVDFAYAVHTDVGNRCVAAKVDRRLSPLRTVLRNGQTVEIITAKGAMPNPVLGEFRGHRQGARAIRQYLKACSAPRPSNSAAAAEPGAGGFQLARQGSTTSVMQAAALGELGMKDRDELLEQIGLGERLAPLVARRLLPADSVTTSSARSRRWPSPAPKACWSPTRAAASRSRTIRSSPSCRPAAAS
jgi:guanosine-3',5'-bis(diphosphate) 3'-pyrophosphohydrolase